MTISRRDAHYHMYGDYLTDVLITRDHQKLDSHGMRGAPDWIAEVLSPGTAGYDRTRKIPAYERAGVAEVWLIDPSDRTVAIYRLAAGSYGKPALLKLKGQTQLAAVPGVVIDWAPVIARLVEAEALGRWAPHSDN